jgi:hypothetical protein
MNESLQIKIKRGSQGLYYTMDGKEDIAFDGHFPITWAVRELTVEDFPYSTYPSDYPKNKKVTGALHCNECRLRGSFNGVIVSYCIECFTDLSSIGERCGCLCLYNIRTGEDITNKPCEYDECCLKTYLKGISLWEIGDREVFEKGNYNHAFFGSEVDFIKMEDSDRDSESAREDMFDYSESDTASISDSLLDDISGAEMDLDLDSLPDLVEADDDVPDLISDENSIESGFYRQ